MDTACELRKPFHASSLDHVEQSFCDIKDVVEFPKDLSITGVFVPFLVCDERQLQRLKVYFHLQFKGLPSMTEMKTGQQVRRSRGRLVGLHLGSGHRTGSRAPSLQPPSSAREMAQLSKVRLTTKTSLPISLNHGFFFFWSHILIVKSLPLNALLHDC